MKSIPRFHRNLSSVPKHSTTAPWVWRVAPAITLAVCVMLTGCNDSSTPTAVQSDFLTDNALTDAMSIEEAVEKLQDADATAPLSLAIEGIIYAGEHDPFQSDSAAFLISELPDPSHGDGSLEHVNNCPFCKRRAESATKALVELRGDDGELIAHTAQKELGVSKGDRLSVEGECTFNPEMNLITIAAKRIHLDR
ncbi:hypothetical protein Mal65_48610 [Crateriforma conspicua]|nr:hypothetical protein Mal65_48610 [Crateriforma conspicua]